MQYTSSTCFAASLFCFALNANAQTATTQPSTLPINEPEPTTLPTESTGPIDPEPELTAQELAEIEAALADDSVSVVAEPTITQQTNAAQFLELAAILDVAGAYFTDMPAQLGAHDPQQTGFTFQQLELSLGANIDPFFRFDANLAFTLFGVEIEEAYGTTMSLPGNFQLRAGQFLTRFGRLNTRHPHAWSFIDQPLVNAKLLGPEGSHVLGAELSWLSPLPWFVELVGSVSGANDARGFTETRTIDGPEDLLFSTAVKQLFPFSPSTSLAWGVSAQFGPNDTGFGNRTEIYGTDLYLRYRPTTSAKRTAIGWTTEFMFRARQVPDDQLQDFGLYSELVWSIDSRWQLGSRYEFVSGLDDDPLDPDWTEARQRVALQSTFSPSHFSRIRLQPMLDFVPNRSNVLAGVMLNLELIAGQHGAHSY